MASYFIARWHHLSTPNERLGGRWEGAGDCRRKRCWKLCFACSQIYNEEVNDLLAPENKRLAVKESREDGVYVAGAVPPAPCAHPRLARRRTVPIRSGAPQVQAALMSLLQFLQAFLLPLCGRDDSRIETRCP